MHEIRTEIEIEATPERVWAILLNFSEYARWNPFARSIKGVARAGERLTVSLQQPGGRRMTFHPTVLEATPNRELRWLGHLLLPGIFDGEHCFQIVPIGQIAPTGATRVRFVQGERFSGLLIPFLKANLDNQTKAGFVAMNEALKGVAESSPAA